ncbi:MAG TPA: hypothetical protein EYG67_05255 [Campylobacterales bacterium]|nr:hypothetical protein [Campylobacterales bacterium]HIP41451.1 hypothetical protein [Campylobacterales bacterium]
MDLDTFANVADIVSIPIGIVGLMLVLHQLYLTRLESEKEHLRMKNEMTLNAYSTVRKDLRIITSKVRKRLNINDMFDHVSEADIDIIMSDNSLRHDVSEMLSLLNKFAVGVKHDIFNIDILNELSGKYFIKTHKQFTPYLRRVRKNSHTLYSEYDTLVLRLKKMHGYQLIEVVEEKKEKPLSTLTRLFISPSNRANKILTLIGTTAIVLMLEGIYRHDIHLIEHMLYLLLFGFIGAVALIVIQLFHAIKKYFQYSRQVK